MKRRLILLLMILILVFSIYKEPINDTIDAIGGATNDTYNVDIDSHAGVSEDEDDD